MLTERESWPRKALRALREMAFSAILRVVGWILATLLLAKVGAETMAEVLSTVPWSFLAVAVVAFLGFALAGWIAATRAIDRSDRFVHWLSRNNPGGDEELEDVAFRLIRNAVPAAIWGKVLEKRVAEDGTGILRVGRDGAIIPFWCAFEAGSSTFRRARKGDEVAVLATPIGMIGKELCFQEHPEPD